VFVSKIVYFVMGEDCIFCDFHSESKVGLTQHLKWHKRVAEAEEAQDEPDNNLVVAKIKRKRRTGKKRRAAEFEVVEQQSLLTLLLLPVG
jgi:hypothetical protein